MRAQCGGAICTRALAQSYPDSIWRTARGHRWSGPLLRAGLPDRLRSWPLRAETALRVGLRECCVCCIVCVLHRVSAQHLLTTLHAPALCGCALSCRRWPGSRAPCVLTYYYYYYTHSMQLSYATGGS